MTVSMILSGIRRHGVLAMTDFATTVPYVVTVFDISADMPYNMPSDAGGLPRSSSCAVWPSSGGSLDARPWSKHQRM